MNKFIALLLVLFLAIQTPTPTEFVRDPSLSPPTLPMFYEPYHSQPIPPSKVFVPKEVEYTVYITSYYDGDSTGSGSVTSTGLTTKQFQVNDQGWYTYKGMVVVGAATTLCLRVKTGACGKYNTIPDDYRIYDLYDEVTLIIKGKRYHGIVLDSCGACMTHINNEPYQRYDIFVKRNPIGKILGSVVVEE